MIERILARFGYVRASFPPAQLWVRVTIDGNVILSMSAEAMAFYQQLQGPEEMILRGPSKIELTVGRL